jgi:hypothetical protein
VGCGVSSPSTWSSCTLPSVWDFRKEVILQGPLADVIPSTDEFEMYPIGSDQHRRLPRGEQLQHPYRQPGLPDAAPVPLRRGPPPGQAGCAHLWDRPPLVATRQRCAGHRRSSSRRCTPGRRCSWGGCRPPTTTKSSSLVPRSTSSSVGTRRRNPAASSCAPCVRAVPWRKSRT